MALRTSADIASVAIPMIGRARTESVLLMVADHQQRVRRVVTVTTGGATGALVPVRDVLSLVLRHDGIAFALAHNHPSGTVEPSAADVAVTARLREAATSIGLRFLDHVVIAGDTWRSVSAAS